MKRATFIAIVLMLIAGASFAQPTVDLNGVTFGLGAGPAYSLQRTFDYTLSTDAAHNLELQPLSREAFVISSILMVKLGKISVDPSTNTLVQKSKTSEYSSTKASKVLNSTPWTGFTDRLSINLALNLADVSSNVTF